MYEYFFHTYFNKALEIIPIGGRILVLFYNEYFFIYRKKFYADYNVKFVSTASSNLFQSHQSHSGRAQRAEVENQ